MSDVPGRRWTLLLATFAMLSAGLAGCVSSEDTKGPSAGDPQQTDGPGAEEPCTRPGWTRFEHSEGTFALCHPDGWTAQEQVMGTKVALLPAEEASETDFASNVNVVTEALPAGTDLPTYVDAARDQLSKVITGIEFESSERVASDPPTQELAFTGQQGIYELRWQQRMILHEGTAYVITYTTDPGEAETPSAATIDGVFASFTPT